MFSPGAAYMVSYCEYHFVMFESLMNAVTNQRRLNDSFGLLWWHTMCSIA